MSEKLDYSLMLLTRKTKNVDKNGKKLGEEFDTTDKVKIPSLQDITKLKEGERRKSCTDFALCNYSSQGQVLTENNKPASNYWLSTPCSENSVYFIDEIGELNKGNPTVTNYGNGIVPSITISLQDFKSLQSTEAFESKKTSSGKIKHYLKLGEYPKTKVSDTLQKVLEEKYNKGNLKEGLTCTGKLFETNGNASFLKDFIPRQNPEFEYNGKRYVRTIANNFFNENIKFSDNTFLPKTGTVVWIEVEPVTFEVVNWNRLPRSVNPKGKKYGADGIVTLNTEEIILTGLPMNTARDKNNMLWQNSLIRCFLNSAKSEELDGNPHFISNRSWDFTKRGFLYQALNLTREPTRTYVVPKSQMAIPNYAFNGCVGIEKLVVESRFGMRVGKEAFDGCNFNYAYTIEDKPSLYLTKEPPKEEVNNLIELKKFKKIFKDFDYGIFFTIFVFDDLVKLVDILNKDKLTLPFAFVNRLIECDMLYTFLDCDLRFLKSEDNVDLTKNEKYDSITMEEKIDYYKFMLALGCFSKEKIKDKNGKETSTLLAQKATSVFSQILKSNLLKVGDFHAIFDSLPFNLKPNQEFLKFIAQIGEKKNFSNLELLINLNRLHPGMFVKVMSNFDKVKTYRTTLNENGVPIKLSWEDALKRFYYSEKYYGVTNQTQDIAEVFSSKGLSQKVYEMGVELRKKAEKNEVTKHILDKPIKEKSILESIEEVKNQTENILMDSKILIDNLYSKQFTYEMLSKYDPRNAIMGLYASCCGTITSSFYGKDIAKASLIAKDVQNLVVRDSSGEIIAKGTLYVNKDEGYAVFNDFEINQKYREYETDAGRYNTATPAQKQKEHERDLIFDAFMRGIKAFVKEWDISHPDRPIKIVNVGMGYNRLKAQCEKFKKASLNLSVPTEYSFKDAAEHQRILYDRKEELKKAEKQK